MHKNRSEQDIHQVVFELADQEHACILAVVLEARGSTPCKTGAKAVLDKQAVLCGTIGGGWVEGAVQQRAAAVIASGQPAVLDFDLDNPAVDDGEPVCGGSMRVLLDPTTHQHRAAFAAASEVRQNRRRGVLLTTVHQGEIWAVEVECLAEESIPWDLQFPNSEGVRLALEREGAERFASESAPSGERIEVLVEPLIPQPILLLVGGGHVGQAVATQAGLVGFDVVVIDDRDEFTREDLFPTNTTMRCGDIGEEVARFPIADDTYIVIVSRGHKHDARALAACLHSPAAYIGMIGSRRKIAMMREGFVEAGRCSLAEFERVHAPIGLDIGAVTVSEIATSIVAQLIAVRRTGAAPRIPSK